MKKLVVMSIGADWAHQCVPGLFESPSEALAAFRADWAKEVQFELRQLDTGTFQILRGEKVEALIVPIGD